MDTDMLRRMEIFTEDWCETIGESDTCTKHNRPIDECHGLVDDTTENYDDSLYRQDQDDPSERYD